MQADCGDSRFTSAEGVELLYYLDSAGGACNTASTDYYVLVPAIPAGDFDIYHYYGNPSATNSTQSAQFSEATFTPGSTSAGSEEKGVSPIAYWSFDEGTGTTVHNQMEENGENGLVSWWKMDEGTGTTVYDTMGVNNGTLGTGTSAPSWTLNAGGETFGRIGIGTSFDGNDYITISDNNSLDITSTITLSAWIKTPASLVNYGTIIGKRDASASEANYVLRTGTGATNDELEFYFYANSSWQVYTTSATNLATNTWYHIAVTYNGSTPVIYVNGIAQASSCTSGTCNVAMVADTNALSIGRPGDYGAQYWSGIIDSVKIFNRALSAGEVSAEYNSLHGAKHAETPSSPTSSWITGAQKNPNQQPLGKALDFPYSDNSHDMIFVQDNPALDLNTITISAWIKRHEARSGWTRAIKKGDNFSLGFYGSGTQQVYGSLGSVSLYSNSLYPLEEWFHVVFTATDGEQKIYINGRLDNSDSSSISSSTDDAQLMMVRREIDQGGGADTAIDEIKIWDYVLTANQVKKEYNRGASVALSVGSSTSIGSTDPISYWRFDEGYGSTAYDEMKNQNGALGTGNTAPAWTDGAQPNPNQKPLGRGLEFDSDNDSISCGSSANIDDLPALTASAWIYPHSQGEGNYGRILDKTTGLGPTNGWIFNTDANTNISFTVDYDTTNLNVVSSTGTITYNKWQHVAVTWDGSAEADNVHLYVDGVEVRKSTNTDGVTARDSDASATLRIGNNSTLARTFDGVIDEVKLYNYVLTDDEIKIEYNRGAALALGVGQNDSDPKTPGSTDLKAWWKLDEGSGTSAYDISGNGNTGTLTNMGSGDWVQGKVGKALDFKGTTYDNRVVVTSSSSLISQTALTLSAWVNTSLTSSGWVIHKTHSAGNVSPHWGVTYSLEAYSSGVQMRIYNGSTSVAVTGGTLTANTWHHVVGTWNGATVRLYLDGVGIGTTGTITGTIPSDGGNLLIGARDVGTTGSYPGYIDNAKIWSKALSAAEIAYEYNGGKPIAHWRLDEKSGATAYDESDNNNDGALGVGTSAPTWTTGKFNNGLDFEKDNGQYVYADDSASLSITGSLTLSAWIKPESNDITAAIAGKFDGTNRSYVLAQVDDELRMYIDTVSDYQITTAVDLVNGKWYHVAAVYDAAAQTVTFYVNGVEQAGVVAGSIPASIGDDAGRFQIGCISSSTTATNFYDGIIDEVKVYNYPLTADQIKVDYNNSAAARY